MGYKDFYDNFNKGKLGSCLFFFGEESYLVDWAIDLILDKNVDEGMRSLDYQILEGEICSASDITSAARAYSMFSERRVVVVRDYKPAFKKLTNAADEAALLELAASSNDSSILIFVAPVGPKELNAYGKKLQKACDSYEFARIDRAQLKGFISKKVREAGNLLGQREMDYLMDLSGYFNRDRAYYLKDIMADLDRINNACADGRITMALIEELMIGEDDRYVFNLVDAITNGDKKRAMELSSTILAESDDYMSLIGLLTKQFEIMYDALELSQEGASIPQMAKATGINEFRFKKAYQSARHFSKDRLKDLLIKLYNIDRDIKNGNMEGGLAFQLFILGV